MGEKTKIWRINEFIEGFDVSEEIKQQLREEFEVDEKLEKIEKTKIGDKVTVNGIGNHEFTVTNVHDNLLDLKYVNDIINDVELNSVKKVYDGKWGDIFVGDFILKEFKYISNNTDDGCSIVLNDDIIRCSYNSDDDKVVISTSKFEKPITQQIPDTEVTGTFDGNKVMLVSSVTKLKIAEILLVGKLFKCNFFQENLPCNAEFNQTIFKKLFINSFYDAKKVGCSEEELISSLDISNSKPDDSKEINKFIENGSMFDEYKKFHTDKK